MNITIGHIYYDLLNLYGESGNILALKLALETQGVSVNIKEISIYDDFDLSTFNVIYMGAGTNNNQQIVLNHLLHNKEKITQALLDNKLFLITGNSIELFGEYIEFNGQRTEALSIFDYATIRQDKRVVAECLFKFEELDQNIIGFINCDAYTQKNDSSLFKNIDGYSMASEGYISNNFYATYCLGPLLARNPDLLIYFCQKIILSVEPQFIFKDFNLSIEQMAYNQYITARKSKNNK